MNKLDYLKEEYVNLKKDVYENLVGTVYPSIVYDAILKVRDEYIKNGGSEYDLPVVLAPDEYGRARVGYTQ
jgi:hypothetical protein